LGSEQAAYWRLTSLDGLEFFKASFRKHSYSRHSHESYAIGVTERGVQGFG
jgi:AraC-like ligand binding domain